MSKKEMQEMKKILAEWGKIFNLTEEELFEKNKVTKEDLFKNTDDTIIIE